MSDQELYDRYSGPYNPVSPTPDGEASISIYNYTPALALALLGAILFGIATIGHFYLWWIGSKKRAERAGRGRSTRNFEFLWVIGSLFEVIGYAFRAKSHYNPFYVNAFIIQYFFIVVAPVFFAAALYLSLKYVINANPDNLRISPVKKIFVVIFIVIDTLTTILQIVGAALIGVAESNRSKNEDSPISSWQANKVLLAGLAAQCASFLVFLIIVGVIIWRLRKETRSPVLASEKRTNSDIIAENGLVNGNSGESFAGHGHTYSKTYLWVLTITSLLIFARTLYRLGETAEGVWGPASSIEALFGVFEYAPVILAALIWLAFPLKKQMDRMI